MDPERDTSYDAFDGDANGGEKADTTCGEKVDKTCGEKVGTDCGEKAGANGGEKTYARSYVLRNGRRWVKAASEVGSG